MYLLIGNVLCLGCREDKRWVKIISESDWLC